MKLCLLIVTAVAIATSYALPVPKEEVFTVYPVNSAVAQDSSNMSVEAKPEQLSTSTDSVLAKDVSSEKKVEATEGADEKPEEVKTLPEKTNEQTSVKEEAIPVAEPKSAPLTESSDVKVEDSPATVAPTEDASTTAATNNDELRLLVSESVVATEPKVAVPDTVAETPSPVVELAEKSVTDEATVKAEGKEPVGKSIESVKVEEKTEENEPKAATESEVKVIADEKSEKLTDEPKAEVPAEPSQKVRFNDLPAEHVMVDVKSGEKVNDQVAVKSAVESSTEEKLTVVEKVQEASAAAPVVVPVSAANDPEPQTEGKDEVKPTKVRAAPIVEGLKVSQPVEAEPAAIAKIHVTVIQEEVALDSRNAAQKEVAQDDAPVTEAEEKTTEAAATTTVATEQEVKSEAVSAVEKILETKDEVTPMNDTPTEVKSEEAVVESKPEAPKATEVSKEESKATPVTVVIVMPSVKSEDVTTVVAVAESTDKPAETVQDKAVPEVRSAVASDELPELVATTAKAEEQQAKAVEGSSQPGASESSTTVNEEAQDQSDSNSTTVTSVTEQDTTTISPVTTTEPAEPVPMPAKQKAKKQVPPLIMNRSVVGLLFLLVLYCTLVPRIQAAPQGSIDFLLGDEELQAVVKPIARDSPSTPAAQEQTEAYEDEQQTEVQATVDATVENEQQTEEPQPDQSGTEDYADEEQYTEDPEDDLLDPVTESPKEDEQNTTSGNGSSSSTTPSTTTSIATTETTTTPGPIAPPSSTTLDSVENNSSEEQLTTNPIVVPESEEQTTTESNEDSNQLAQDVNDFIHDLANEVRSSAIDKPRRPQQQPKPSPRQYSTVLPTTLPERYDSKSVESNEDDDQVQLKVNPNDEQTTNGPSLTEDQFRSLFEKLPWFGQQRVPGYDQWQHQGFPQRSSWQHRDDRQRHYQSHGSDSFQGHGFHRSSWH
uniref:Uncharacterized protein n=1 Tax=Anopheles christyi TaxID=43041 RepID=A0A182JVI9_9DIPT